MTSIPAAEAGASAPALPVPDHRREKRKAIRRRRRLVLLLMSPWIVGLHRLPALPAGHERLPVAEALRPAEPAALDRARELPLRVHGGPQPLAGDQEHALDHRRRRPAAGALRLRPRHDADAGEDRRRFLPDRLLPARARAPCRGHPGLRLHPQPGDRPDEHGARAPRDPGPALVQRSRLVEALPRTAVDVGGRHLHDHLPRRDPRGSAAPVRVGRPGRREPVPEAALGDDPVDQPCDPLLGRPRRDLRPPVLHAGLGRRQHRWRERLTGGLR